MTAAEPRRLGLWDRVRGMLLTPGGTLRSAAGEHLGPAELYRSHVIPLALIPPVCSVVGILVFGGFQVASVACVLTRWAQRSRGSQDSSPHC